MTDTPSLPLKVFLCHSSGDKPAVLELYRRLDSEGWIDAWLDSEKLYPGQDWNFEIEKAVEESDVILVCLTKGSVNKEGYVQRELRIVLDLADYKPEGTLFVIPVRLEECDPPRRLRAWQYADYFPKENRDAAYRRLLVSLKMRAQKLGILSDKSKEQPAPKPAEPAPAPKQLPKEEKPPEERSELETLKSQAIQFELMGELWDALQIYYKIKKIDPAFPRVDVKIQELEKELRPHPMEWMQDRRQEARPRSIPRKAIPWRFIAGLAGRLALLAFSIWGGISLWNNLPTSTPEPTRTSQPVETDTPAPAETSLPPIPSSMTGEDGMTLLYVPAGKFTMGSDSSGYLDEMPIHKVNLDAFWVDQTEVTNKMYSMCVNAGICKQPTSKASYTRPSYYGNTDYDNYPVIHVDWNMAKTYCDWVDRRLPTEAEWEKAARGTDGNMYPWGNYVPNNDLANYNSVVGDTTAVGTYPNGKSAYGTLDMAGNVWEWVSSLYQPYPYNANDGRENLTSSDSRVLRGGAWDVTDYVIRSARRVRGDSLSAVNFVGFRCAINATP